MLFAPGVIGGEAFVPSAILISLAALSIGGGFFAVWMQLSVGGKVGWRLLLVSGASSILSWVLLWGVFPLIYG